MYSCSMIYCWNKLTSQVTWFPIRSKRWPQPDFLQLSQLFLWPFAFLSVTPYILLSMERYNERPYYPYSWHQVRLWLVRILMYAENENIKSHDQVDELKLMIFQCFLISIVIVIIRRLYCLWYHIMFRMKISLCVLNGVWAVFLLTEVLHLLFQVVIDRNHLVIGVRGQPSIIKVSYFHRDISGSFSFRAGTFI